MWNLITWDRVWTESSVNKPSFKAGAIACTEDGSIWRYVQANAAIAKGDILMKHVNTGIVAALDGVCQAASTNPAGEGSRIQLADAVATAANLKGNWFDPNPSDGTTLYRGLGHDYWITIDNLTGAGQVGYIYNRDQTNSDYVDAWILDSTDGDLATATDATSEYQVYTDSLVVKCAAVVTNIPVGVAQKAVTSGAFFWSKVKGKGIVGWDTSEAALQADDQIVIVATSSGVAGKGQGTTGTMTTAEYRSRVGTACSLDVTADGVILVDIDVLENVSPANTLYNPLLYTYEWPRLY